MPKRTRKECYTYVQAQHYTKHKDWGDEETYLCEQYECWDEQDVDEKIQEDANYMFEFVKGK